MTEECPYLNLVLFKDALEHLSRIARVLTTQRGSILLVGLGGSGKKSLSTLATALSGCEKYMISPHSAYKSKDFKTDLINMMKIAGIRG
jgi:dynein heavy chain